MTITHFVAELDSGQNFNFRAEQRSGATVVDSYLFGSMNIRRASAIFASIVDSGVMGAQQLEIIIGTTKFTSGSWG